MTTAFEPTAFQNNAFQIDSGPGPSPVTPGAGSSGGDSQWTPPGWLLDRLYDEERLRAEEKKVKRSIKAVAKQKASLQESLQRPSVDYASIITALQELSKRLQALLGHYALIRSAIEEVEDDREGDELIELLSQMEGVTLQ